MKKQDFEDLQKEVLELKEVTTELKENTNYTKIGVGLLLDMIIDQRKSSIRDLESHPGFMPPSHISSLEDEIGKICNLQGKLFGIAPCEEEESSCCKKEKKVEEPKEEHEEK